MSPRRLAVPALVLLGALGLILSFGPEEGAYRLYSPTGYVREVDRLIVEGKLVYDCAADEIVPRELSAGEEFFVANSYLRRDLAAWRAGDRRPFVVEREELAGGGCRGRLLAADAAYHNQRLPTYTASAWKGRLFFHQGAVTTTLASPERTLEVARAPWALLPLDARAFEDVWFGRGDEPDVRSQKLAFKMHEAGRAFASLEPIGDQAALEVLQGRPELTLNGCPVPVGWRLRLDSGDALRLAREGGPGERYAVEAGDEAGLVSFVSTVDGEVRRKTFGNRLAMGRDVAYAVDAVVVPGLERGGRDDFDVHLTLDAFFNDLLSRELSGFCRRRYGRRPLRAAVTLLEPESGRLLALASYPTATDLAHLRLEEPGHGPLLGRNHNFLHHPVGSAAKPFLAAAALATEPRLAGLEVPCFGGGTAPGTLLGFELGTINLPGDCGGGDSLVDFRDFLKVSSNRYMLYLGLLAMADWGGDGPLPDPAGGPLSPLDRYRVGAAGFDRRPLLPVVREEAAPGAVELKEVQDEELFANFARLFDGLFQFKSGTVVDGLDLDLWQPVLAAAGGASREAIAFAPVTPEKVNLKANLVQQLRQDLYTLLLGNGNNRWSNVQLAEATARLVTGRWDLEARLVEKVAVPAAEEGGAEEVLWQLPDAGEPGAVKAAPLAEHHRRLIVEAMAGVTAPGGTAAALAAPLAALNRAAPPGVEYRLLGKTGTPSSELETVRRGPTAPGPGAVAVYSGQRMVNSAALVLAVERRRGDEVTPLVAIFFIEGQGGSEETVALAAALLAPLVQAYWPEDWLERQ